MTGTPANPNSIVFPLNPKLGLGDGNLSVEIPGDPLVAAALLANTPLPDCDYDFSTWALGADSAISGLPFPLTFGVSARQGLASYLKLETALEKLGLPQQVPLTGLFPLDPRGCRYTLLTAGVDAHVKADATFAFAPYAAATASAGATGSAMLAAIAAVEREMGARDQLGNAFQALVLPSLLSDPAALPSGVALVFETEGGLNLTGGVQIGYNFNWLREVAAGALKGDIGLHIDTPATASVGVSLAGRFLLVVNREEDGWIRLRVFKSQRNGWNFASRLEVGAKAATPLPDKPDELLAALLGVHELQWLRAVERGETPVPGVDGGALASFFKKWNQLDTKLASLIWEEVGKYTGLAEAKPWILLAAQELGNLNLLPNQIRSLPDVLGALLDERGFAEVLRTLRQYALGQMGLGALARGLASFEEFNTLDPWVKQQLTEFFGTVLRDTGFEKLAAQVKKLIGMRDEIYAKTLAAIEKSYSAQVSYQYEAADCSTVLVDCSFSPVGDGWQRFRDALKGAIPGIGQAGVVRLNTAVLTHGLSRRSSTELHLPYLSPQEWEKRLEALGKVTIEDSPDGRLMAYTVDASERIARRNHYQSTLALAGSLKVMGSERQSDFTLTYNDQRNFFCKTNPIQVAAILRPVLAAYEFGGKVEEWLAALGSDGPLETALSISVPAGFLGCWLNGPAEDDPNFAVVFSQVSVAVQRAMRRWLPFIYFSQLERYDDLGAAQPLMVYQASLPFAGKGYAYDVQNPVSTEQARRSAMPALIQELTRVERLLVEAGRKKTASFYASSQAPFLMGRVERDPRLMNSLLLADALFANQLVALGKKGRQLSELLPRDPAAAVRELSQFAASLVAAFHGRLNRLYGGMNLVALGSLILVEATNALAVASGEKPCIKGVLRIRSGELQQTFVNASFGAVPTPLPVPALTPPNPPAPAVPSNLPERVKRFKLLIQSFDKEASEILQLLQS